MTMVSTHNMQGQQRMLAVLDIGTCHTRCLVGEQGADGRIKVVGIGMQPTRGIKRGVVVNIDSCAQTIRTVVEEAEHMAGCTIHSVTVGLGGSHISGCNSHGIVAVREGEVTHQDLERVIDAARAVAVASDQQLLHVIPQQYLIDHQEGIKEPLGMSCVRLEAKVHLVMASVNAAQNLEKCIRRCDLSIDRQVLQPLASSTSVLTDDERELGVCMLDIGAGTTDLAVYAAGAIVHSAVIPIAGDQLTNDMAMALRTPTASAEELKVKYACALRQMVGPKERVKVPGVADRPPGEVSRKVLAEVVEARFEEIFQLAENELRRSGFREQVAAGLVLTGGSARMEGAVELAEEIFHLPVRLAQPAGVQGMDDILADPVFSGAVGLLRYAGQENDNAAQPALPETDFTLARPGIVSRLKAWFQGNY